MTLWLRFLVLDTWLIGVPETFLVRGSQEYEEGVKRGIALPNARLNLKPPPDEDCALLKDLIMHTNKISSL